MSDTYDYHAEWKKEQEEKELAKAWRAGLKVGDEVTRFAHSYYGVGCEIVTITQATATRVRIGRFEYRRDDGRGYGSTPGSIGPVTRQIREKIESHQLLKAIQAVVDDRATRPTLEQLRAMKKAYEEAAPCPDSAK